MDGRDRHRDDDECDRPADGDRHRREEVGGDRWRRGRRRECGGRRCHVCPLLLKTVGAENSDENTEQALRTMRSACRYQGGLGPPMYRPASLGRLPSPRSLSPVCPSNAAHLEDTLGDEEEREELHVCTLPLLITA